MFELEVELFFHDLLISVAASITYFIFKSILFILYNLLKYIKPLHKSTSIRLILHLLARVYVQVVVACTRRGKGGRCAAARAALVDARAARAGRQHSPFGRGAVEAAGTRACVEVGYVVA